MRPIATGATWITAPEDQGQMVIVSWAPAGDAGAIERTTDLSIRSTTYRLYRWQRNGGDFAPWNGSPIGRSVIRRSRPISAARAEALLSEVRS